VESFTSRGIVADTRHGLMAKPKWLSSLYFYDARGSQLFEDICKTPEYYPTRTERAILIQHAAKIAHSAGHDLVLGELGSGSSVKSEILIAAILAAQERLVYVPVDVSQRILKQTAARLEAAHAGLHVHPVVAEYGEGLQRIAATPGQPKLVLFLGSSIGNFEPDEQEGLLAAAAAALAPGDAMLVGTDMVKDAAILEAAYDDAAGVTAAFNKNILHHLNRELDGDADPEQFRHVALWNAPRARIEMHLESLMDQTLHFPGANLDVRVARGERIHTENSYKFTPEGMRRMAAAAGWKLERSWYDARQWFGLHLLRR
jgi:L-histidine Nalpha-methyltransferase